MPYIKTFIFDVDGVLTNGEVTITTNGDLLRTMYTRDGYAMRTALIEGYEIIIISGGYNEGVKERLAGLGVQNIYLGVADKLDLFNNLVSKHELNPKHVLYMGDDIPDYEVMCMVGLPSCPKDAAPEIQNISNYISQKKGGRGCVRDVIEQVLKVQGNWNKNFKAK